MGEWSDYNVRVNKECTSASSVNVRVVWLLQHRNVQVLVWSMCEWSDYNVRVNKECTSASSVNVRVVWLLQHRNVQVLASLVNVRVVRLQCTSEHGMCECE